MLRGYVRLDSSPSIRIRCRSNQTNKNVGLSYPYAIKALEALFVTLWVDVETGVVMTPSCVGLNDVIAGDVATEDAATDDAASDTGDGEPRRSRNAEDAGAMPCAP